MTEHIRASLGVTETGERTFVDLGDASHVVVQGMTRSGKSQTIYGLVRQIVGLPEVRIAGCDPSGVLLAPFLEAGFPGPFAVGSDVAAHLAVLEWAVELTEQRVAGLAPARRDKIEDFTPGVPLIVLLLEEFAALVELAEADDVAEARKPADRLAPRLLRCLRRLVAESGKAGVRVVLITQRAEANLLGGASRSNFGSRFSLRVDNAASVTMLHPSADPDLCARVERFSPGVALVDLPGQGRAIVRGPETPYRTFYEAILAARLIHSEGGS